MIFTAGIYENIRFEEVGKTEQGALKITIRQIEEDRDELAMFRSNSVDISDSSEGTIIEFLVSVGFGGEVNEPKRIKDDITIFKAKLNHVLSMYMPVDDIVYRDSLAELGITAENVNELIQDQDIVNTICESYVESFIDMFENRDTSSLLRLKLVRSSEKKHYGKFPRSTFGYGGNAAFIESMDVPLEQSKLRFSDWEAKRGDHANRQGFDYSDPSPMQTDPVEKEEAENTERLFNGT